MCQMLRLSAAIWQNEYLIGLFLLMKRLERASQEVSFPSSRPFHPPTFDFYLQHFHLKSSLAQRNNILLKEFFLACRLLADLAVITGDVTFKQQEIGDKLFVYYCFHYLLFYNCFTIYCIIFEK